VTTSNTFFRFRGATKRGDCPHPTKSKFKKTDFVGAMILNVLRDLTLSRKPPLKSAEGQHIRILKNTIKNFGCFRRN
jgi:hypothetical protein